MVTRHSKGRRRLLPKPPEPPAGYAYFYWRLVPIAEVETCASSGCTSVNGRIESLPSTFLACWPMRGERRAVNVKRTTDDNRAGIAVARCSY
jgi:hypothetical protein